jgi:hypothetical protein
MQKLEETKKDRQNAREKFHTYVPKKHYFMYNHPPSEITKRNFRNCSNDCLPYSVHIHIF